MLGTRPNTIYLRDYAPPEFAISAVDLDIALFGDHAIVKARLAVQRRTTDTKLPLILQGDELQLISASVDGRTLGPGDYDCDSNQLTLPDLPDGCMVETVCRIHPHENTQLMGLYASKNGFFTQCEAEGFRRITYFLDRPDVMAKYTTTIHADKAKYPFLLSNGNPVASGDEAGGRHWAKWEDPFPKPSYLFAMVAADLDRLEDSFTTMSGREVKLSIFVEHGKLDQSNFAMKALKKSMKWDEDVFGLEMDLDNYMIVAVGDFNMGAMENKGLNIFNTKYVLARPDTATDLDYMNIDRVVAHEYFHNWTGNRVTCRDWFQLSLKEGLTVFRDQEFGADMYSRAVQRIQEVRGLRAAQFPEDAGPMAHPVRPQSYMEIGNFYTATVYEKGAEVVRMIHTLVGKKNFRTGMDLYFERHDGQAVTTDDFVQAMQDASGVDLAQFNRWYDHAGTPALDAKGVYDSAAKTYTLSVTQSCGPSPGQPDKQPFHIPLAVGLVGPDGKDIPLRLEGEPEAANGTRVLSMRNATETFCFVGVPAKPVPSLLRQFSAPVVLKHDYSDGDLAHLMAHDSDSFNRWEAGQRLSMSLLLRGISAHQAGQAPELPEAYFHAMARLLENAAQDPAFAAEALSLPSEGYIAEQMSVIDPDAIHAVRTMLRTRLARTLSSELLKAYHAFRTPGAYSAGAKSAGRRAMKNLCLSYLMELNDTAARALCLAQFDGANNMTDSMAALTAFANTSCDEREAVMQKFHDRWKDEALVLDKWFAVQATSRLPDTLGRVKALLAHSAFDLRNPNKVRAVIGSFCQGNQVRFNAADGSGYWFAATQIGVLDKLNPQVAARLARAFDRWKKIDTTRQQHARAALETIRGLDGLSKDTMEVVTKALA
ncbi:MAG: aminopeptidase N [Betaproteobacteria bacterium]|nr:aminopeptidase N [Betaproteobacteria bacterium]